MLEHLIFLPCLVLTWSSTPSTQPAQSSTDRTIEHTCWHVNTEISGDANANPSGNLTLSDVIAGIDSHGECFVTGKTSITRADGTYIHRDEPMVDLFCSSITYELRRNGDSHFVLADRDTSTSTSNDIRLLAEQYSGKILDGFSFGNSHRLLDELLTLASGLIQTFDGRYLVLKGNTAYGVVTAYFDSF